MYYGPVEDNDIIYSVDKIRLKTYISYSLFTDVEFRFDTCWAEYVERKWTSGRAFNFFYNYSIKVDEDVSFYFGFLHNSEKREFNENLKYNLTVEFNPNKVQDNKILLYILDLSGEWYIKRLDMACDLKVNILDIIYDKGLKRSVMTISNGFDDKTYRIGKGNGHVKIYNKKKESNLDIDYDLTRIEITMEYEDFLISNMIIYRFDKTVFPEIYLQKYCYSFSDYKDKTMLAIMYAVQNGFPINELSRAYKTKLKNMLECGHKIKFNHIAATQAVRRIIFGYFNRRDRKSFVHFR